MLKFHEIPPWIERLVVKNVFPCTIMSTDCLRWTTTCFVSEKRVLLFVPFLLKSQINSLSLLPLSLVRSFLSCWMTSFVRSRAATSHQFAQQRMDTSHGATAPARSHQRLWPGGGGQRRFWHWRRNMGSLRYMIFMGPLI